MSAKKNQPNYPSNFPGDTPRPFDPSTLEAGSYGEMPKSRPTSPPPLGLDFDSWADERISIFASLDAAMTHHILEAVSALGELRRRAEEDARQATREIDNERVILQREIAELLQQKASLQEELQQVRRDIEEERARIFAFHKEAESLEIGGPAAPSNLSREVANLNQQMQLMAQQMQELLQQRRGEGVISYPEAARATSNGDKRESKSSKERRIGANELVQPVAKAEQTELEIMMSLPLQEFSEAPTPRLRSNGKGKAVPIDDEPLEQPVLPVNKPTALFANLHLADQLDMEEPDFFELFQKNEEKASPPRPDNKANRRQSNEAEQRVQRLLSKRSDQTGPLEPEPTSNGGEAADSGSPVEKQSRRKQDKAAMTDIGAKLGLDDINTPPPGDEIKFGHGFTPPPQPWQSPVWVEETPLTASLDDIFQTPPTPNESPARIGELGPDFAVHWGDNQNFDALLPPPVISTPPPIRPTPGETKYPPYPMQPPPSGSPEPETEWADDVVTKITISNLQGLSLLMMEKVVRGLPGVRHVTVTDFRRGELEMEVRHQTALELDRVLPTLPDLKLKLVSRDNGLNFAQIRSAVGG